MVSHHTNRILIKTQVHFQLSIINVVHRRKGREYSIKKIHIYPLMKAGIPVKNVQQK